MVRRAARPAGFVLVPRLSRGRRARLWRWLRVLLVSVIVAGLPPVAEAVDLLLGQARAVEVAAVACQDGCDDDCGEGCQDAGCHGDLHHCGCCATTTGVAPPAAWSPSGLPGTRDRHGPVALRGPPDRAPPPPWQPPRA